MILALRIAGAVTSWICAACEHRNPTWRFVCRRCRTERQL